jgi:hypothetical protein
VRAGVIACVLVSGGCFILPKTETTRQVVSTEQEQAAEPAAAMRVELATTNRQIAVRAVATRTCRSETWQNIETRRETTASLEIADPGGGSSGYEAAVFLLLAPVTLAVSGIITAIIVASSDPKIKRERHKTFVSYRDCSIAGAGLPVTIALPSGVSVELVTGDDGRAYFDMPDFEAEDGVVEVAVGELSPQHVHYCPTCVWPPVTVAAKPVSTLPPRNAREARQACLQQRSERMIAAQQVDDLQERTRLLQALPVCPPATE